MVIKDSVNNRIVYIDAIRTFSIYFIILIHSTAYINDIYGSSIFVSLLGNFCRFSVTLFVFLSGLCLAMRYNEHELNINKYIIMNFAKIVPAYLIWSIIYKIYYVGSLDLSIPGLINLLKSIIFGNAASHLYFVPVLIGLYYCVSFDMEDSKIYCIHLNIIDCYPNFIFNGQKFRLCECVTLCY